MKKTSTLLTISLVASGALMAGPGKSVHDLMDYRLKGQSNSGTLDDSAASEDGLGIVALNGAGGPSAEVASYLETQKAMRETLKEETNPANRKNIRKAMLAGKLSEKVKSSKKFSKRISRLKNVGMDFEYPAGSLSSCKDIKKSFPASATGEYKLSDGFMAKCDMSGPIGTEVYNNNLSSCAQIENRFDIKTTSTFILADGSSVMCDKNGNVYTPNLFTFSTHTFTNCGQTGYSGPTYGQCTSAYNSTTWKSDKSLFNVPKRGYQLWTVPETGTYRIEVAGAGAARGSSGYGYSNHFGARMRGDFNLNQGDKLLMVVGQLGGNHSSYDGGGGGSFVTLGSDYTTSTPLIIAGGAGGGDRSYTDSYSKGTTSTSGQRNSRGHSGGSNGQGGFGGGGSGGGGGFYSNGGGSCYGYGFRQGAQGANCSYGDGGFGGGSGMKNDNGGAGGGYSGGATGYENDNGGGGGSYNSGANQSNTTGANSGHGYIKITKI